MSVMEEITNLFASLALNLKASNEVSENVDDSIDLSITKLNQSLNFNHHSRVRVLDTALSLMCFTSPQVFDSVIEYSVKTIVAVLCSSINCKVIQCDEEAVLSIGGLISSCHVGGLVETCGDILGKLKARGLSEELPESLCDSLLCNVLRVAISASSFQHVRGLGPILDAGPGDERTLSFSKLRPYSPKEISVKKSEIPLRLMFWYLDPLILKNDVTRILQESIRRPFLCLDTEICERIEWRSTILSLAFSPFMFIETRSLLHNWFLSTGFASLLELQIKLVSLVLDIISRPMRWGISADMSLTLPFSHAYFPYNHQFLRILAGPLTCGGLLQLIDNISKSHFRAERCSTQAATKSSLVDHKSMWAMAVNFPNWFYFSSVLLFLNKSSGDRSLSTFIFGDVLTQHTEEAEPFCSAAASYIAWILNPIDKNHQDVLAQNLVKMAGTFTSKQYGLAKHTNPKKLKRPKIHHDVHGKEYDCQIIRLWIEDFQDMYSKHIHSTVNSSVKVKIAPPAKLGQNMLLRRILLGILIGYSDNVNEEGWELLLHYAATGMILLSTNTQDTGLRHKNWKSQWMEGSIAGTENFDKEEAEKGACLVFYLADVAENMSDTLIDSEENESDFICRVKSKASKYLLKCVHRLLNLSVHEDYPLVLLDLRNRLVRWIDQGDAIFQGSKDVRDTIEIISKTLSSL